MGSSVYDSCFAVQYLVSFVVFGSPEETCADPEGGGNSGS